MLHRYDVAVRWSDEDRMGHVNNSRYLTFTEDARLSWLADSPSGNGTVILARSEIDFVRPVHFVARGRLVVHTSVVAVGRSSMRLRQDVFAAAGDAAAGDVAAGDVAAGDIAAGDIAAGDIAAGDIAEGSTGADRWDRADAVARTEHVMVGYDYELQRSRPWRESEAAWLRRWIVEEEAT